jgi:hypothetical protein
MVRRHKKMTYWCYGLVEEEYEEKGIKGKRLVLCEVYYEDKDKIKGAAHVDWNDLKSATKKDAVLDDITGQFLAKSKLKIKNDKVVK